MIVRARTQSVRALRWAVPVLAILLGGDPAEALDPQRAVTQYAHDKWYAKDGLPQNSVHAIVQTRDGYLWFGTEEGLVRFDGVRFTVFDRGNTPELRSNYVPCLLESRDGSLWLGTLGGGLVRMKDGRFTRIGTEEGLTSNMVRALYEDADGTLWIGTVGGGLNWLRDGRLSALTTRHGLSHDFVRGIAPDGAGGLWLATAGGASHVSAGRVDAVIGTRQGLSHEVVMSVYRDRRGRIWLCTQGGVDLLENGKLASFGRAQGLPDPAIFTAYEDRDGNLWVGGEGGLSRYRDGRFTSFTEEHGLSGNRVRAIREDREGNLWVGSFGGGLNRLRDGKLTTFTRREGLPHDAIGPVFQDRHGVIWIGTMGGGLSRYAGGRFTNFTTADGLPGNIIESIHESRDGTLWIGTFGRGLVRHRDGRFTTLNKSNGLSHDVVMCVREGADGTLWIGTNGGGLNRYRDGRFSHFRVRDGLAHDLIRDLHFDKNGALWISTFGGGLGRLENGVFSKFTRGEGLSSDVIGQIHEEADGTLWITTLGGGLIRRKNGRFAAVTSRQGLHDDGIYALADDGLGHFWMSCNNGIFRVAKDDLDAVADGRREHLACLAFGEADGMRNRECNGSSPGILRTRDGRLWFPTLEGVAVLDPTRIPVNPVPPPVRIERLVVNGSAVAPATALRIAPGARKLEIHYTALSFSVPSRVRFRYRLEGFEEKWVEAGDSRAAYYTNLPPGDYRFRLAACNDDGVWNESGASVSFRLEPFYYQTWWFAALLILSALGLGVWIHKLRVRRLTARARILKGLVEERTRAQEALTASNRQLEDALESLRRAQESLVEQERLRALGQMASGITHDFNNALAPILGFTDLLLRRPELLADREKARAYLKTVQTAAKDAGHMVSRLREFYRARDMEEALPLVEVNPLVEQAVSLTQPKWKDQALADNLTITVRTELQEVPPVPANASDLREALTNLIFNAVDALPQGGTITLATRRDGDHLVIEVRDDGVGMNDEVRRRCLEPFFTTKGEQGTGLGLPMIYGIVQRHAGALEIDTGPGRGTAIAIRLPVRGGAGAEALLDGAALDVDPLDILVVDDEPAILEFLSTALHGDGHRVETAKDGMEALFHIKDRRFDLIVTDRAMPRMAGDQLAAAVRVARPGTRIILLTGFGEIMLAQGDAPEGVDKIVSKPVSVVVLRSVIASLFGPTRQDQERARAA